MYSLKNLKNFKGHEGEPLCQGTLHGQDGKVADWSDDSHGGPMRIHFVNQAEEVKFAAFAATYLADKKDYTGNPHNVGAMPQGELVETALTDMSTAFAEDKELAKHAKNGIAYYVPDVKEPNGKALFVWKAPFTADNVAKVRAKHPDVLEIINERLKLPFVDSAQFTLAERNKRHKRECKRWTLFSVKDPGGEVKVLVIKTLFTSVQAAQIRAKFPNLVEIINERYL